MRNNLGQFVKGFRHTEESKKKISFARKGKSHSKEWIEKIRLSSIGKKGTNLGRSFGEEWRKKISLSLKGHKVSEKSKSKMSDKARLRIGEKATNWQGGISFEPYSVDWKDTLKKAIRERDKYICQLCLNSGNAVHHIDYDKKNCSSNNLINLCIRCNSRVNSKRDFWKEYFTNLLNGRSKV